MESVPLLSATYFKVVGKRAEVEAMGPASMSVFFQELLLLDSGQPHPRRCLGDQQKE